MHLLQSLLTGGVQRRRPIFLGQVGICLGKKKLFHNVEVALEDRLVQRSCVIAGELVEVASLVQQEPQLGDGTLETVQNAGVRWSSSRVLTSAP